MGKKLQILMEAVNSTSSGERNLDPCPVYTNTTTSASRQTAAAQRQLQWHHSDGRLYIFKLCSDQAKVNANAKVFFDVCHWFFDLYRFRVRFPSV